MSAKLATLGLLKIKTLWNIGHDIIIAVHDVINKILFRESSYTVDVVMWPKFVNSSIFMGEVIITSILYGFDQKKNNFFEVCYWFKFNNLGLTLGLVLMFYINVEKGLKLKVRKLWVLTPTFVEVTEEKMVGGLFAFPPTLNRPFCPQSFFPVIIIHVLWLQIYHSSISSSIILYCQVQ